MDEETRASFAALMAKINDNHDRVMTRLDGIHEAVTVSDAATDRTRKAHEHLREELRDLADGVAGLQRVLLKHGSRLDDLEKRLP